MHLDSQDIFYFGSDCSLAQNYKVKENARDQERITTCGLKKEEARNSAINNKLSSFVSFASYGTFNHISDHTRQSLRNLSQNSEENK